ncbi:MAG: hypothetical protein NT159_07705 [Proteobacteria bacterium]|nr:hypothetical protein [Pseudomonadota bacterium]
MSRYAPWEDDRRSGNRLVLFSGITGLFTLVVLNAGVGYWWIGALLCLLLLNVGLVQLRRAGTREFGKDFEEMTIRHAIPAIGRMGYTAHANRRFQSGDIDLVVSSSNATVTIEIKSFIRWRQFYFFKGEREGKALRQATRQRAAIDAVHAIVWLPQGIPSLLQRLPYARGKSGVTVVFGREAPLRATLRRCFHGR